MKKIIKILSKKKSIPLDKFIELAKTNPLDNNMLTLSSIIDNEITVSCGEGETGYVYEGNIPSEVSEIHIDELPKVNTPNIPESDDPLIVSINKDKEVFLSEKKIFQQLCLEVP